MSDNSRSGGEEHPPGGSLPGSARDSAFRRVGADGRTAELRRSTALEVPIALEFNGLGYAVLMATPADLVDLATGFALTERLIDQADEIIGIDEVEVAAGRLLRVTLVPSRYERILARVRHRVSDSSCGLCGIENLEQALRPLPAVSAISLAGDAAIFAALGHLDAVQALNRATGATHAAAMVAADGTIRLVREDVGRHNAFDKLIGAALRAGHGWDGGFTLMTSRCSYELVEKAALSGCPMLVTISAATSLALDRAAEAKLTLRTIARRDSFLEAMP